MKSCLFVLLGSLGLMTACTPVRYANTLHGQLAAYQHQHGAPPLQTLVEGKGTVLDTNVPFYRWTAGAPWTADLPATTEPLTLIHVQENLLPPLKVPQGFPDYLWQEKDDTWNGFRRRIRRFCAQQPAQCPDGPGKVLLINWARVEASQHEVVKEVHRPQIRTTCYSGKHFSSCTTR